MSENMTPSLNVTPGTHLFPWWLVLIQGIITLILGIFLLYYPYGTLLVLVTFLGAYWFVSGLFGLISLFVDRTNAGWKILFGILGIIAGIAILTYPLYSYVRRSLHLHYLRWYLGTHYGIHGHLCSL